MSVYNHLEDLVTTNSLTSNRSLLFNNFILCNYYCICGHIKTNRNTFVRLRSPIGSISISDHSHLRLFGKNIAGTVYLLRLYVFSSLDQTCVKFNRIALN